MMREKLRRFAIWACPPLGRLVTERDFLEAECRALRARRDALLCSFSVADRAAESVKTTHPVSVLYLARAAEGVEAFCGFVDSYRRHPAGTPHDLVVIYKGFTSGADLEEARSVFADLPHTPLMLHDGAYDLGSYALAASRITSPFVFCLNTFSEVLSDDWLAKIMPHIQRPDVGVVGTSCSYESTSSSLALLNKALFFQYMSPRHGNRAVHEYLGFLWGYTTPRTRWHDPIRTRIKKTFFPARPSTSPTDPQNVNWEAWLESWYKTDKGPLDYLLSFHRFPNPHVRSNAFVIRRERLLAWLDPLPKTKFDCAGLECGPNGLTRQLHREGLTALAVGANGEAYPMEKWPTSAIFRSGTQNNNLVGDNRTREFLAMPPKQQTLYRRMSWGDYLMPEPGDFPDFDVLFQVDPTLGGFRSTAED